METFKTPSISVMEHLLGNLGYRKFTSSNEPTAISYMRSYKTYTLYIVKSKKGDTWFGCITFGKTEISIPNTITPEWLNEFHETNTL